MLGDEVDLWFSTYIGGYPIMYRSAVYDADWVQVPDTVCVGNTFAGMLDQLKRYRALCIDVARTVKVEGHTSYELMTFNVESYLDTEKGRQAVR